MSTVTDPAMMWSIVLDFQMEDIWRVTVVKTKRCMRVAAAPSESCQIQRI